MPSNGDEAKHVSDIQKSVAQMANALCFEDGGSPDFGVFRKHVLDAAVVCYVYDNEVMCKPVSAYIDEVRKQVVTRKIRAYHQTVFDVKSASTPVWQTP